jgi:iron complex outermembrane receptor protein
MCCRIPNVLEQAQVVGLRPPIVVERSCCRPASTADSNNQGFSRRGIVVSNSQERLARYWVRAAVAAALGASLTATSMTALAAAPPAEEEDEEVLDEVQVTGSRIVRRDLQSNSPLVTVEAQQIEDSTFVSLEEALNDLPQFMAGGVSNSAAAVTSLQAANGLDGGRGTGDALNSSLLDPAGTIGIVVPGAANVNLRGLGANRSLTLVDGHRGMPTNATMTVDMNTIPSIAIGNIEVITGGASAVYGADALAGVTNIKFRDNFEGLALRVRGGINEVGDGGETQISALMGTRLAGKGNAMIGIEYTKRETAYWKNRDFFLDVMESPYSGSGDYLFAWEPFYAPGGTTGTFSALQGAWNGNGPTQAAVNAVFDARNARNCPDPANPGQQLNCIANATGGLASPFVGPALFAGYHFNTDGTLFVRGSQTGAGPASVYYGPQGFNGAIGGESASRANPNEIACTFTPLGVSAYGPFAGERCAPSSGNRVDYGRWLSSPREAYSLFGRSTYQFDNGLEVFANFNFATSTTETRREPSPAQGNGTYNAIIPFHTTQGGDAIYLPSLVDVPAAGQTFGATRPEYLAGGSRGTSCAPTGGCTMAQAFPVPDELRALLESRPINTTATTIGTTGPNANNPFRGLSACYDYALATNPGAPGVEVNPNGGAAYLRTIDPRTGQPMSRCGPNAGWSFNQQLTFLPVRGTTNKTQLYQFAAGLRGDLHVSDWTWELYLSQGDSQVQTNFNGFTSLRNYLAIMSAPNYGQGYSEAGTASKFFTCTSGLNPFDPNLVVSQDCLDAVSSNQIDRHSMQQRIYEVTTQGHAFELPAGEARAAFGASYRKNDYAFTPDSLRERDYTGDANSGAFATGSIDEFVSAKEVYGELLLPILRDLPLVESFELELGARNSKYSTGQTVDTYKALASWVPVQWLRARGGYNRAERAPNMSELFATPSGSSQFASAPTDPCRASTLASPVVPADSFNVATNPNRAQLQALCSAQINAWGGNNASDFHANINTWDVAGGGALVVGNPDLKNEKGDTWTVGLAFTSPSAHPLLSRIVGTVDWYEAVVTDPIEVQATAAVVNSCFNINGANPTYTLDDPGGFCDLIEREPSTGAIARVYNTFGNQGKMVIRGLDFTSRWSAALADLGMGSAPGTLSLSINGNYLIDQIQRFQGSTDQTADYAGFLGASRIRTSTGLSYSWGNGHRVLLGWQYRLGTQTPTTYTPTASADGQTQPNLVTNPILAGYATTNLFTLTGGTRLGPVNASLSINNLLDTKPKPAGYDHRDPRNGFGSFNPYNDLVGRRYSINLSMDF